jgi:hypothetical protein
MVRYDGQGTTENPPQLCGVDTAAWGRALGYLGADATVASAIRRLEARRDNVPETTARLARMFDSYGIPRGWDRA